MIKAIHKTPILIFQRDQLIYHFILLNVLGICLNFGYQKIEVMGFKQVISTPFLCHVGFMSHAWLSKASVFLPEMLPLSILIQICTGTFKHSFEAQAKLCYCTFFSLGCNLLCRGKGWNYLSGLASKLWLCELSGHPFECRRW